MTLFTKKNAYSYDELISCAKGVLFGKNFPELPLPPLLMFDKIIEINSDKGKYNKGQIIAKLKIKPDLWFFKCHFRHDPVMPGCLGVDALWQLLGFFLGWNGGQGSGRALGAGKIRFDDQVLPKVANITYIVDVKKRMMKNKFSLGIADGMMKIDDSLAYIVQELKVGLFKSL